MRSKSDYFLFREKDRRLIKCCRLIQPRYHDSDDRALDANIRARPGEIVRYVEGRVKLPVQGARMSRLRGRHFLRSCPPPWRRCRGGSARAATGSAMARDGFWTNATPLASKAGYRWSRAGAWGDASARCSRATATIAPSRLATLSWPTWGRTRSRQCGDTSVPDIRRSIPSCPSHAARLWTGRRRSARHFTAAAIRLRPHPFECTPHSKS